MLAQWWHVVPAALFDANYQRFIDCYQLTHKPYHFIRLHTAINKLITAYLIAL